MNPFVVLNLPITCTDRDVRDAYHRLLRKYPPETKSLQFQAIHEAATLLKTEASRWKWYTTYIPSNAMSPLEVVQEFSQMPERRQPPGIPAFKSLLRACAAAVRK